MVRGENSKKNSWVGTRIYEYWATIWLIMIQKCIIHVTYQVTWIWWGCFFRHQKKWSQKMIGILGSDTTKDGNPLCFFVVVGSACPVESNHRDVGERCLETKPLEVSKAVDFKFHICHRHSSFIIYHHSSFSPLFLKTDPKTSLMTFWIISGMSFSEEGKGLRSRNCFLQSLDAIKWYIVKKGRCETESCKEIWS